MTMTITYRGIQGRLIQYAMLSLQIGRSFLLAVGCPRPGLQRQCRADGDPPQP